MAIADIYGSKLGWNYFECVSSVSKFLFETIPCKYFSLPFRLWASNFEPTPTTECHPIESFSKSNSQMNIQWISMKRQLSVRVAILLSVWIKMFEKAHTRKSLNANYLNECHVILYVFDNNVNSLNLFIEKCRTSFKNGTQLLWLCFIVCVCFFVAMCRCWTCDQK